MIFKEILSSLHIADVGLPLLLLLEALLANLGDGKGSEGKEGKKILRRRKRRKGFVVFFGGWEVKVSCPW